MRNYILQGITVVALSVLCTGCWDAAEIDRLAIVTASGIDLVDKSHASEANVVVTAQIARPSELGSSDGGGAGSSTGSTKTFVLEQAKGQNFVSAFEEIRKRLSRRLFLGQRRVIVIGEKYAKHGVDDIMDEIIRNPQSRLRTYIIVAYHDKAQSILELPYALNRLPADAMVDLEEQNSVVEIDAKQFIERSMSKGDPFAMGIEAVNTLHKVSGKSPTTFALTHIAIFRKGKLVGWLGGRQLQGFLWVEGHLQREDTTVKIPGQSGYISGRMLTMRLSRNVTFIHGKPQIDIHLHSEYDIEENGTILNLNLHSNIDKVRMAMGKEISSQMVSTFDVLQHTYQSDPFGFSNTIYWENPHFWEMHRAVWRKTYSEIPVNVHVQIDIRNSGLVGSAIHT